MELYVSALPVASDKKGHIGKEEYTYLFTEEQMINYLEKNGTKLRDTDEGCNGCSED